ncbi:MAG: glycosyltransferase family 39 protein [Bacteroidetes bacterium]|nr:glycosyltransferase family 39 protein [Bacteroidota bacterium]
MLSPLFRYRIELLIILFSGLIFIPFLGQVHLFDWDEINFAECAREMIVSKDYLNVQINFQPFWEKPPLFIWMQVLSMKLFGINEFAARFPNAICGIVSLLVIYRIGKQIKNSNFGLIWILTYVGSILPSFYFRSGIIDPWFNLFIFCSLYFFFKSYYRKFENFWANFLSGMFIGLAILTKGPVAFILVGITIFLFCLFQIINVQIPNRSLTINKEKLEIVTSKKLIVGAFIFLLAMSFFGGFWFLLQLMNGNSAVVYDFIIYQIRLFQTEDAGHGGFLGYHFVVLFFGVLPASIFAIQNLKSNKEENAQTNQFRLMMLVLFWVVLILFSLVKTKIIHYSSLAYFPITFFAALFISQMKSELEYWRKWFDWVFLFVGILFMILFIAMAYVVTNAKALSKAEFIKDEFAKGNLQAHVHWTGLEFLIGLIPFIIFLLIRSKYKKKLSVKSTVLFAGFTLFTTILSFVIVPKIEGYSQRAAIDFYISKQEEDCYVTTFNFKSYAHLFYKQKKTPKNLNHFDNEWLLRGNVDKKVYVVCKVQHTFEFETNYTNFRKLKSSNGFVFYERNSKNSMNTKYDWK